MQRRAFIEGVLAGGAAVAVGRTAGATQLAQEGAVPQRSQAPDTAYPPDTDPQTLPESAPVDPTEHVSALLAPLGVGDEVGLGWSVAELSGVSFGAAILTLVNPEGDKARVHLCRRNAGSRPIAHSDTVDLFLMNQGDGSVPTTESLGRVLNVLSALIRHNEMSGAGATEAMLSHEARLLFYRAQRALV